MQHHTATLKKSFQLVISCRHENPSDLVTTEAGEIVCKCGVILEEKTLEAAYVQSASRPSLYHQVENGGDPKDMKVVNKKIHISNYNSSSEFSNICNKLDLKEFIRHRAWRIYHMLQSRTYFTRAKCATFSIFIACREGGQSVSEAQIMEAVRSVLCVKKVPSALHVISELHDDAMRLGINTNEGHSSNYYLNLAVSSKQHLFDSPQDYDRFKMMVMNNFARLEGNNQSRARKAANIALSEMGVNG